MTAPVGPITFSAIYCVNMEENHYNVYLQNGKMFNHISFQREIDQFGSIVVHSPDGLNFVLKKEP